SRFRDPRTLAESHAVTADEKEGGQQRIYAQLRTFISETADKADLAGKPDIGRALRDVLMELEWGRSATKCLENAVSRIAPDPSARPAMFGPLWYDVMEGPSPSRHLLGRVIEQTRHLPLTEDDSSEALPPPTLGVRLRQ